MMPTPEPFDLPKDPEACARALIERSLRRPILIFKKSPICPVSTMAEHEFRSFLKTNPDLDHAVIDVIAERPLARGLTAALDIAHQSPQALLFHRGVVAWHDSHGELTVDAFKKAVAALHAA